MTNISRDISDTIGITDTVFGSRKKFSGLEIVSAITETDTLEEAANILGISRNTLKSILPKAFLGLKANSALTWKKVLLSLVSSKECPACSKVLPLTEYSHNSHYSLGVACRCKKCKSIDSSTKIEYEDAATREKRLEYHRMYQRVNLGKYSSYNYKYKTALQRRIPAWANLDKIQYIYSNRPDGMHVDHIVPLNGRIVCGLHVEYNLQYLTAGDNLRKSNKFNTTIA